MEAAVGQRQPLAPGCQVKQQIPGLAKHGNPPQPASRRPLGWFRKPQARGPRQPQTPQRARYKAVVPRGIGHQLLPPTRWRPAAMVCIAADQPVRCQRTGLHVLRPRVCPQRPASISSSMSPDSRRPRAGKVGIEGSGCHRCAAGIRSKLLRTVAPVCRHPRRMTDRLRSTAARTAVGQCASDGSTHGHLSLNANVPNRMFNTTRHLMRAECLC